jgi:hypothetical protein
MILIMILIIGGLDAVAAEWQATRDELRMRHGTPAR